MLALEQHLLTAGALPGLSRTTQLSWPFTAPVTSASCLALLVIQVWQVLSVVGRFLKPLPVQAFLGSIFVEIGGPFHPEPIEAQGAHVSLC